MEAKRKRGRPRKGEEKAKPEVREKRQYITNVVVEDKGVKCPHCGNRFDHDIKMTFPNGNRRALCGKNKDSGCGKPFVIRRKADEKV